VTYIRKWPKVRIVSPEQLTLKISKWDHLRLTHLAALQGKSRSALVRESLERTLSEQLAGVPAAPVISESL